VPIGSVLEKRLSIIVDDERGRTLFTKTVGTRPGDGLRGYTATTVSIQDNDSRGPASKPDCPWFRGAEVSVRPRGYATILSCLRAASASGFNVQPCHSDPSGSL